MKKYNKPFTFAKAVLPMAVFFFAAHTALAAPAPKAICVDLAKSIDASAKEMSKAEMSGFGDDSAPRETNRQLEINNQLLLIQMNLSLMSQYRCQLPRHSIQVNDYMVNALSCRTAQMGGDYKSPKCDLATWVRDADHKEKP